MKSKDTRISLDKARESMNGSDKSPKWSLFTCGGRFKKMK